MLSSIQINQTEKMIREYGKLRLHLNQVQNMWFACIARTPTNIHTVTQRKLQSHAHKRSGTGMYNRMTDSKCSNRMISYCTTFMLIYVFNSHHIFK